MKLYHIIIENTQYIIPKLYKKRFFKKLIKLSKTNIVERGVEPELLWIKEFLSTDSVFIDIGANVGSYLFIVESKLKANHIFAFEPNHKLYEKILRLFPKLNVYPYALSNINTTAEFKIPIIEGKQINTRGTLQTTFKEDNEQKYIMEKVEVRKLDDIEDIKKLNQIDFIKIDVEGNEIETLMGAKETILKHKPTLMVEMEQRHHDTPLWELIMKIVTWGYTPYYLDRKTMKLNLLLEEKISKIQSIDLIKDHQNYINNIIFLSKILS